MIGGQQLRDLKLIGFRLVVEPLREWVMRGVRIRKRLKRSIVDKDPLLGVVPAAVIVAHEAKARLHRQVFDERLKRTRCDISFGANDAPVHRFDGRGVEITAACDDVFGGLTERASGVEVAAHERVSDTGGRFRKARCFRIVAKPRRHRGGVTEAPHSGERSVGKAALLAVPVHLPDGRVCGDDAAWIDKRDQHFGDLVANHGPVRFEERHIVCRVEVHAEGPKEKTESIELDIRAVCVAVRFLFAVAEVAGDRDAVGAPDFERMTAARCVELELDRGFGFLVFAGADKPRHRVGHVADPRDIPLRVDKAEPWRKARQDLPEAISGFANLAHAKHDERLRVKILFEPHFARGCCPL